MCKWITENCQKAVPPTAASKYIIIMKICTSVTSMLSGQRQTETETEREQRDHEPGVEGHSTQNNMHTAPRSTNYGNLKVETKQLDANNSIL